MAVPGFSISELLNALKKCKELYDAFCHQYRRAAGRLATFHDELERVGRALEFRKAIYERTGKVYPGADAFQHVVEECSAFLAENKALLDRNRGAHNFDSAYRTVMLAFDDNLPRLRTLLSYNWQEYMSWKLDILLEIALSGGGEGFGTTANVGELSPATNPPTDENVQLRRSIADLIGVIDVYRRLKESGAVSSADRESAYDVAGLGDDEPTTVRLNALFWTTIASICRLGNIAEDYRPPYISLQGLPDHLGRLNRATASPGTRYPHSSAMIFPRPSRVRIRVNNGHRARVLTAASYIFIGRRFIFHDKQRQAVFEHRVPHDCHPYTYHRKFNRPSTVAFMTMQDISLLPDDSSSRAWIEYFFAEEEDYARFQSDLRRRKLLREFHVSTLTSANSKGGADAYDVSVKLWQEFDKPDRLVLSSPVTFQDREKIFEWNMQWFQPPKASKRSTAARLDFKLPDPDESKFTQWRAVFGRRLSTSNTSESSGQSSSSASSINPVDLEQLSLAYAPPSWLRKVKFLDFGFHEDEGEEFLSFLEAMRSADATANRTPSLGPESLPVSTFASLSGSPEISLYFGSPASGSTMPYRLGRASTSTVGTSPMSPTWQKDNMPPSDQGVNLPTPAASSPSQRRISKSPMLGPDNMPTHQNPPRPDVASDGDFPVSDPSSAPQSPVSGAVPATPRSVLFRRRSSRQSR